MRKTALFLVFVMIVSVLVSCKGKTAYKDPQDVKEPVLALAQDGKCEYVIVYPDQYQEAERIVAMYIRDVIEHYSGATVEIKTDWVKDESEIDPNAKEILVGNTNRQESAEAVSPITAKLSGNKIVIKGVDDNCIYYAAGAFVSRHIKNSVDGVVYVPKDLCIEENAESVDGWMLYAMPVIDGVDVTEKGKEWDMSVTERYNPSGNFTGKEYATLQFITDVELSQFEAYIEKLESYGYVVDSRTESDQRYVVSLFRACAGRDHRYCLTLDGSRLSISQIVPFKVQ